MKRPSFQFYPDAWLSNAKLKRCKHVGKGVWVDVMCMLHDSDEYGVLRWPLKELANAVHCQVGQLRDLIEKGVLKGADYGDHVDAYIYTPRHAGKEGKPIELLPAQPGPIWYSSRMVRDEYVRSKRGEGTRFGDEPKGAPHITPTRRNGSAPKSAPTQREGDGPPSPSPSPASRDSNKAAASNNASTGPGPGRARASSEPTENPEVRAATLRGTLSVALRDEGVSVTAGNPYLTQWIELGVTVPVAREAVDRARLHKPKPESIPAKYLDPIVREVLQGAKAPINGAATVLDWWESAVGIFAKAVEQGVEPAKQHPDIGNAPDAYATKCLLIKRLGDGPWVDHRNQTEMRMLKEHKA